MKTIKLILILIVSTIALRAETPDQVTPNRALTDAGAPIFHRCGEAGQLLVTGFVKGKGGHGEHIVWEGERLNDLQLAINFDPVVRQAIMDGIARAQKQREAEASKK